MGTEGRRQRERLSFRQNILDAARDIAAKDGWQSVTIRRIAEKIEYSGAALYEYFPNKEAILLELMREGFRSLTDDLRTVPVVEDASAYLAHIAQAYWDFAFNRAELYQVMHGLDGIPFGSTDTPQEARDAFASLRDAVRLAMPDDGAGCADLDGETEAFWAGLHGVVALTMAHRIQGGKEAGERLMQRIAKMYCTAWQSDQ